VALLSLPLKGIVAPELAACPTVKRKAKALKATKRVFKIFMVLIFLVTECSVYKIF
jgi:hypothetical protein